MIFTFEINYYIYITIITIYIFHSFWGTSCFPRQNFTKSFEYLVERDRDRWSNMSSESCAFYMKIRGRGRTAERRDDPGRLSPLTATSTNCDLE